MINPLGVFFSLFSASTFGLTNAATRRGVLSTSASIAMYFSTLLGVPLFALMALALGEVAQAGRISGTGYLWLMGSGIMHFILGRYCNYRAIGAIGSNRLQPISATNLMFTVALSVLFLGERPALHALVGTVLLILGPISAVSRRTSRLPVATAAGSRTRIDASGNPPPVRLVEGYVFGVGSALFYGSSPVLIRLGLEGSNLGVLAAAVACAAAAAVLGVGLLRPGQVQGMLRDAPPGGWFRNAPGATGFDTPFNWLLLGALAISVSQLFRYLAISVMDVSLASPLISLAGVFSVFWAWVLNRRLETFSTNVMVGIALSIVGSIVLIAPIGM